MKKRLDGKTVVFTGGSSGIGKHTVRYLSMNHGAKVIIPARYMSKCEAAVADMEKDYRSIMDSKILPKTKKVGLKNPSDLVECRYCDLANYDTVRQFAKEVEKCDILVNNAAVFKPQTNSTIEVEHIVDNKKKTFKYDVAYTVDKQEETLQTNHTSHFLLSNLLLPKMRQTTKTPTILNVSCEGHLHGNLIVTDLDRLKVKDEKEAQYGNRGRHLYTQSKLANILFTKEAAQKWPDVTVFSVNPGSAKDTGLGRHMTKTGTDHVRGLDVGAKISHAVNESASELAQNMTYLLTSKNIMSGWHYTHREPTIDLPHTEGVDVGKDEKIAGIRLPGRLEVDIYDGKHSDILWKISKLLSGLDKDLAYQNDNFCRREDLGPASSQTG